MKFGVYAVRDVKSGFQTPTCQVNDAVASRGFASAVMNSDSVLFTHAQDFALYRIGEFDADKGALISEPMPVLLIEASNCLKGVAG